MSDKKPHMHHGHRERTREELLKSDFDALPEHKPLEHLLFYAIPRGDVNATAHRLINKFGSLARVMDADYNELIEVEGVGDKSAKMIHFMREFAKLYIKNHTKSSLEELFDSQRLREYCYAFYVGVEQEEFHCLFMTDNLRLIAREKIYSGSLGELEIPVRKIARAILRYDCSRLVMVHNHPAGSCIPSRADVDSTKRMRRTCADLDVELIDHIVVGRDGVISMRENGFADFGGKMQGYDD
ncbi:MAG: DNA repair protein RadC [Oscillospiraceae bacterium]|nr:DNA repair protein RadC [Oscillospiraceae bacterium]